MSKAWKEAASLLIACRSKISSKTKPIEDFKMLMMKRSNQMSFFPSTKVFPGGAINEADWHPSWERLYERAASYDNVVKNLNLSPIKYPLIEENMNRSLNPELSFRICAIRETFEETGLLFATTSSPHNNNPVWSAELSKELQTEASKWRERVSHDAEEFVKMCATLEVLPNIWALFEWNNWLTPAFKDSKRFDTVFYLCCVEDQQMPELVPDNKESTQLEWSEPSTILQENSKKESPGGILAPPQIYELHELRRLGNFTAVHDEATIRNHHDRLKARFLPVTRTVRDRHVIVLPGDRLYDEWLDGEAGSEVEEGHFEELEKRKGPLNRIVCDLNYKNEQFLCNI